MYDIDAWIENKENAPLSDFRTHEPKRYTLALDEDIPPAFCETFALTKDVVQAVYLLRMHKLFSAVADRYFPTDAMSMRDS